jgi:hypothetical protein
MRDQEFLVLYGPGAGSKNYNFNTITPVSVSSNLHTIIVGLNYRFNWSGGPKP